MSPPIASLVVLHVAGPCDFADCYGTRFIAVYARPNAQAAAVHFVK